jgi:hypothetical protein
MVVCRVRMSCRVYSLTAHRRRLDLAARGAHQKASGSAFPVRSSESSSAPLISAKGTTSSHFSSRKKCTLKESAASAAGYAT